MENEQQSDPTGTVEGLMLPSQLLDRHMSPDYYYPSPDYYYKCPSPDAYKMKKVSECLFFLWQASELDRMHANTNPRMLLLCAEN